MKPRPDLLWILPSLVAWGACLASASQLLSQEIPEGAGARVITYSGDASPSQRWVVGAPVLSIGGRSAAREDAFQDVVHVALLGDGMLVVADGASSELRFFDSTTGVYVKTVGGAGKGPGEIDGLWRMWLADSLIVVTDVAGAASYYSREGSFLYRRPTPISALGRRMERVDFLPGGAAWAFSADRSDQAPGSSVTLDMRVEILKNDNVQFLTVYPWYISYRRGNGPSLPLAFGPVTVAAAAGDHMCMGFPGDYSLDCFSPAGIPQYRIERPDWEARDVTYADREQYYRANEAANEGAPGYAARLRENTMFAEHHPAFGLFIGSTSGDLWVGPPIPEGDVPLRFPSPEEPTVWSVYSPLGAWLSDVTLPARFRPMSVTHEYVVGVARGDLDVEAVVLLPIRRR